MRLNGIDNEPLGIVSLAEAFRLAEEANVDLVEIAPNAVPPVCRLMDYGKFKYSEQKKAHEAKLKQKIIQVKEIKFRPGTDEGDYSIKLRNLIKFLEEGDKTKITLRFRGREMAHQDIGQRMLERLRGDLEPYGQVDHGRAVSEAGRSPDDHGGRAEEEEVILRAVKPGQARAPGVSRGLGLAYSTFWFLVCMARMCTGVKLC